MNKTISFAIVHFTVAFSVGYLMTGSVMVGGAIALVEPMVNTVAYYFHENVWQRIQTARARRNMQKSAINKYQPGVLGA